MNELNQNALMTSAKSRMAGTTLIEVLIAIVIFVVGMLALAHLQGNLTRSSSDANMRTVAASIAEEIMEDKRNFRVISPAAGLKAYDNIVGETLVRSRGGLNYTAVTTVQSYVFDTNKVDVKKVTPPAISDFKHLKVSVTWGTGLKFQVDQTGETSGKLGGGTFVASTVIPRVLDLNNAKVAAEDDDALGYPPVKYTPGARPDIVAVNLGQGKHKESTTPAPVVRRRDELIETWFDVITYNTNNQQESTFSRREEFVSISCECTLKSSGGSGSKDGRLPTLWNGANYVEGLEVAKPYGVSASNTQSQYCDVCCNDHHDVGGGVNSYRPRASSFNGDHPHYNRNNQGVLTAVNPNGTYIEACRLIRKDGFFRVAQDFGLDNHIAFPENYLDDTSEVSAYSAFVTGAVDKHFFPPTPPVATWVNSLLFDGLNALTPTNIPTASGAVIQQFRSRGVYTDVINQALKANLDACFNSSGNPTLSDPNCTIKNVSSRIEVLPYFDLQLTQLARWTAAPTANPIDITNQEIANNGYSRGLASLAGSKYGTSIADSTIHNGNVGLISIQPIRPSTSADYMGAQLFVSANGGTTPPPGSILISGTLTNAGGTGNEVASVSGFGATCTRPTNTTFLCVLDPLALVARTITISNYYKLNQPLIACASAPLSYVTHFNGLSLSTNFTTYTLPADATTGIVITVVKGTSCP